MHQKLVAVPVIPATWEAEMGRIEIQGQPWPIILDPSSKITRAKWTGGVAQVVDRLLCKWEVLSSNPAPPKTNRIHEASCYVVS
jgi:hypothetical protein